MALDYIDRDPQEMERYADAASSYYESMIHLLEATKRTIDTYKLDLDDNSFKLCEKFDEQVATIKVQLESYNQLAEQIRRKARNLQEARDNFRV